MNTFLLNISLICIAFMVTVLLYISIVGPWILRKNVDMEKDLPQMVPLMALSGVVNFLCFVLAMWPVWGILTPVYILVIFFGSTFSMMFLPSGELGNLLFWIGLGSMAYVSHTLPHDPIW